MKTYLKLNPFLFAALFGMGLSSCTDKIELDLPEGERYLVVEGWITNQDRPHQVKLTYTSAYFSDAPAPVASGAEVIIADDLGNENLLEETQPGIYTLPVGGEIGRTYNLRIALADGTLYESTPEKLLQPVPIDTAYWALSDDEPNEEDGEEPDDIYEVLIDTNEPPGLGDYYQWRTFLNGVEFREPFDIFTISDEFVDGNPILGFNIASKLFSANDTVTIVQERISRPAYEFLAAVQTLTAFVGSPFDSPPAPIDGNVRNLSNPKRNALGFFGVSATDEATTIVGVE